MFILKILVSAVLLYFLLSKVDYAKILTILETMNSAYLFVVLMSLVAQVFLASLRWKKILDFFDCKYSYRKITSFLLIGLFFNQILPSSVGGDAIRTYYISKKCNNAWTAARYVLLDRLFGIVALLLILIISSFFYIDLLVEFNLRIIIALSIATSIFGVVLIIFLRKYNLGLLRYRLVRFLVKFSDEIYSILANFKMSVTINVISLMIHFLTIVAFWGISSSLSLDVGLEVYFFIVPIVIFVMLVPISIAGWGVREGALVYLLGFFSVSTESALVLSIIYGITNIFISLFGGIAWLAVKNNQGKD